MSQGPEKSCVTDDIFDSLPGDPQLINFKGMFFAWRQWSSNLGRDAQPFWQRSPLPSPLAWVYSQTGHGVLCADSDISGLTGFHFGFSSSGALRTLWPWSLRVFLIVTSGGGLMTTTRERPGLLLNILQCTAQLPNTELSVSVFQMLWALLSLNLWTRLIAQTRFTWSIPILMDIEVVPVLSSDRVWQRTVSLMSLSPCKRTAGSCTLF